MGSNPTNSNKTEKEIERNMEAQTLVLDSSYQALGVISWERAMTLWFQDKVEIVEEYADLFVRSAKQTFKVPSVVRFVKGIIKKIRKVKFSRENVYTRDKGKCQYCTIPVSREEFTLDHVLPRAQGGMTSWENVVVCCVDCNRQKADKTPEQARMRLKAEPIRPKNLFQVFSWAKHMPLEWRDFLYWNGELIQD